MNFKLTLATTLLLTLLCSVAWADDRAKSDEHFRKGAQLYHEGDYSQAILELQAGYELAPHPVFLVNIALAYAKLGNHGEAARWAQRAAQEPGLEADPHAQTSARGWAWQVQALAGSVATDISSAVVAQQEDPVVDPIPSPPPKRQKPGVLGWAGIGAVGLGLFGVGGSVITGAALETDRNEFEIAAASGDRETYDAKRELIDKTQRTGQILLFSGLGLIAVGTTLFVIDMASGDSEVAVGPGSVSYRWVF